MVSADWLYRTAITNLQAVEYLSGTRARLMSGRAQSRICTGAVGGGVNAARYAQHGKAQGPRARALPLFHWLWSRGLNATQHLGLSFLNIAGDERIRRKLPELNRGRHAKAVASV